MRILHIVPGLEERGNGIAVAARLIATEQGAEIVEAKNVSIDSIRRADEVWVHSMWSLPVLLACWRVIRAKKPLVRMLHACVDPVRLKYHWWKKRPVSLIEKWLLRKAVRLVATCEAEKGWIQAYLGHRCPPIIVTDIKRFFRLPTPNSQHKTHHSNSNSKLHLLCLGRRHPLKGLEYLETALATYYNMWSIEFRAVSNAFGEEKEKVWEWCDVLVLPTLSDNFGLVIAEALERGKRVITTDGAPAWGDGNDYGGRLIYLKGYREGLDDERVELLRDAIERLCE